MITEHKFPTSVFGIGEILHSLKLKYAYRISAIIKENRVEGNIEVFDVKSRSSFIIFGVSYLISEDKKDIASDLITGMSITKIESTKDSVLPLSKMTMNVQKEYGYVSIDTFITYLKSKKAKHIRYIHEKCGNGSNVVEIKDFEDLSIIDDLII